MSLYERHPGSFHAELLTMEGRDGGSAMWQGSENDDVL